MSSRFFLLPFSNFLPFTPPSFFQVFILDLKFYFGFNSFRFGSAPLSRSTTLHFYRRVYFACQITELRPAQQVVSDTVSSALPASVCIQDTSDAGKRQQTGV